MNFVFPKIPIYYRGHNDECETGGQRDLAAFLSEPCGERELCFPREVCEAGGLNE